jgi:hypothetical protein
MSGLSPRRVLLEETGIWARGLISDVTAFLKPSLKAEGIKTGFITYVGTGGYMKDGVYDMQQMFYNPKCHDILEFDNLYEDSDTKIGRFIPAW